MMWLGGGRVVARMRKLSLVEQGKRRWKNAMDRKSKATVERRMRLTPALGLAHHRDQCSLHCNNRQFVKDFVWSASVLYSQKKLVTSFSPNESTL